MKTTLKIEIESKDELKAKEEEKDGYTDISKEFHEEVITLVKNCIRDFTEELPDGIEDNYIEGYDDIKDYGLTIKINKGELKNG